MQTLKSFLWALLLVGVIRSFLFEPFHIPSSSMLPNLLVGDYLFVNKYDYGYGRYSFPFDIPVIDEGRWWSAAAQRGDMIVFRPVHDAKRSYIKRVVGVGGDTIQMQNGTVFLNGEPLPRQKRAPSVEIDGKRHYVSLYEETNHQRNYDIMEFVNDDYFDNTPPYTVPDNHYFVMGDNRDASRDSRDFSLVGFVPHDNVIGKAEVIFFSLQPARDMIEYFFLLPWRIRYHRLFRDLTND